MPTPSPINRHQTRALLRIREMILRGELRPGQRVAEAPLAELLGMSRTPVRQSLPVLAQEGLLAEHEVRGYVVRGVSSVQILDAIDLRGVLEGVAARRIAEAGAPPSLLDALRRCLAEGDEILAKGQLGEADEVRYSHMNARFHELIVDGAQSIMLTQSLERVGAIAFASPQAVAFDGASLARLHELVAYAHHQHHAIVAALARGEGARVEALMREHANPVKESLNLPSMHGATHTRSPRLAIVG